MSNLLKSYKPGKVIEEYLKTSPVYDEAESEVKPARRRVTTKMQDEQCPVCGYYCLGKGGVDCIDKPSFASQPESPPFQYNTRLEILAEQIRVGKSVSMKDTLEVDSYLEQKQKALVKARTSGELALEITAGICALGILGLVLWGLVT